MNSKSKIQWLMMAVLIALAAAFAVTQTSFALTPAGTVIGNSATATYRDTFNNEYTTTSNIVQTVVLEVCAVDVMPESGVTMNGIAGQTVYLVYQIENAGNGENTFNLSVTDTTGSPAATYSIYRDANQNGVVDPAENTPITQLTLSMGETGSVIVGVALPAGAGAQYTFNLNAAGTAPAGCTDLEAGTVNVVNDALITATKAVDLATASPNDLLNYTVTFINNGTKAAKSHDGFTINGAAGREGILVYDQIPAGSTFDSFVNGNPTVNPTGYAVYSADGTAWFSNQASVPDGPRDTNSDDGDDADVYYVGYFMEDATPTNDIEEAVLAVNQQGTFVFKVKINLPFDDTDRSVDNSASVRYSNDGGTQQDVNTNEVHTTIPASATADITNGPSPATSEDDEAPPRGNSADYTNDNTKTNVIAGSWVTFTHQVINDDLGNNDVIDLSVDTANSSLPAGSIVEFWNSDGSAKLVGNSVGSVTAGGGTRAYTVKVFIPSSTAAVPEDGTIDYYVTILAASTNNPSEVDRSRDNIDGIVSASVDIARNGQAGDNTTNHPSDGNTDGTNDGDDILPAHTAPIDPGTTATYSIQVVNTGGSSDSFALTATTPVTPIPGGTIRLFEDANCDGVGDTQITDTPLLGGTVLAQAATDTTSLVVQDVANFNVGDRLIVGLNGTLLTVQSVNIGTNTIVVDSNVTASAGTLVSESYCVVMTVATLASTPAASYNIVVTAASGVSSASNDMDVNLTVNEVCGVTVSPDGSDQVPPGGTTTYVHTVVNTGNSTRYVRISHSVVNPQLTYLFVANDAGWKTVGADGDAGTGDDGTLNDGDTAVIGTVYIQLAAGASAQFRIRVFAPSGVTPGTVESVTLTAAADKDGDFDVTTDQCIDDAVDTTTVIQGFLQLTKSQSITDTDGPFQATGVCGAGPDGIPAATSTTEGGPCDEITYTVRYQNIGTQDAVRVVISDTIPNYTTYVPNSLINDVNCNGLADDGFATMSDDLADDTVEYDSVNNLVRFRVGTGADATTGGTLTSGQQGCIIFKVKIQ